MSIPEVYSLVLNSQTSPNITNNSNLSAYSYNVNWAGILPQKYKKYSVNFQLKSPSSTTAQFQGTQSTASVLTVNVMSYGQIYVGMQYINLNALTTIVSFGSGTGGTGTYNISGGVINASATVLYSINTVINKNLLASINFGKSLTYDPSANASNQIGMISPSSFNLSPNVVSVSYNTTTQDNAPILINYPNNNNITVSLNTLDGSPYTNMPHYCLQLYFNPIIDDDDSSI